MASIAEARSIFEQLPSDQLAFWENLYQSYTRFSASYLGPPVYFGNPLSGFWLFYYSYVWNDWMGLPLDQPYWVAGDPDWSVAPDSPAGSSFFGDYPIFNQWEATYFWGFENDRLKYRVRKSYWTGIPRRRRNL